MHRDGWAVSRDIDEWDLSYCAISGLITFEEKAGTLSPHSFSYAFASEGRIKLCSQASYPGATLLGFVSPTVQSVWEWQLHNRQEAATVLSCSATQTKKKNADKLTLVPVCNHFATACLNYLSAVSSLPAIFFVFSFAVFWKASK